MVGLVVAEETHRKSWKDNIDEWTGVGVAMNTFGGAYFIATQSLRIIKVRSFQHLVKANHESISYQWGRDYRPEFHG